MNNTSFVASCVQMNSGNDMLANISRAEKLTRKAVADSAQFVALPENAFFMGANAEESFANAQTMESHKAVQAMQKLSSDLKIWLLFCVAVKTENTKLLNRSILMNPQGVITAHYDKIHLFDVDVPGGESHRESDNFAPGQNIVTADLPWGKLGMSICYDLRFPYLFRNLAQNGAKIITVPSAFTHKTGAAHWHILLRARAIETSSYIIAPAQCGKHPRGRQTYGHSLIIDPWGNILAEASEDKEEVIIASVNIAIADEIRVKLPGWKVDRF